MRATDKVAASDQVASDQPASDQVVTDQAAPDEDVDNQRDDAQVLVENERDDAEAYPGDEAVVAEPDVQAVPGEETGDAVDDETIEVETVAVDDSTSGDRLADADADPDADPGADAAADPDANADADPDVDANADAAADLPDLAEDEFTGLWPPAQAQAIRERWREVQLRFVDDPQAAAVDAAALVDDATQVLVTAIESQRTQLGAWRAAPSSDTEQLRVVVQRYREFVDRVLGV